MCVRGSACACGSARVCVCVGVMATHEMIEQLQVALSLGRHQFPPGCFL